jgi:adenine-specific DNA-methyltransferase
VANLSKIKRERMLEFLESLKAEHTDDKSIRAFTEIENQLRDKKYGLVWEEHTERVDELLEDNIPVFIEDKHRQIATSADGFYNFILEGDNLQSLYLLEKTHKGSIDVIYIDPPYNTLKSGFTYNDTMVDMTDDYRHSKWLSFMNVRLKIAKQLLSPKGVVFISIDNSELYNLKLLCDEIFTEDNFLGNIVWRTTTDNNVTQITTEHEYILCYALNKGNLDKWTAKSPVVDIMQEQYLKLKAECGDDLEELQKKYRKWIKNNKEDLKGFTHYDNIDEKGVFHDGDIANTVQGGYKYEVLHPVTHKPCKIPEKGFRFSEPTMRQMLADNNIMFGKDETTLIKPKIRLTENKTTLRAYYYEDNRVATKSLERLFGEKSRFSNPKSVNLLKILISFASGKDATILDFFAGSGSTAEAVMDLNKEDGGKRKFILCTNNEISAINTIRFLHSKGVMLDYTPGERTKESSIYSKIDKYFDDKQEAFNQLFGGEKGKREIDEYGICRYVTYPRVCTVITGKTIKEEIYSEGSPSNLKYFKCGWTPRKPEEYLLSNALCLHIKEMIELQNAIEIDQKRNIVILNKDDFKKTIGNSEIYAKAENIWINQNMILGADELELLCAKGYKYIPKEFFGQELREAAE